MRGRTLNSDIHIRWIGVALVVALLTMPAAAQKQADTPNAEGRIAPILTGLGNHHHPITTQSKEAQQFFDQGLRLCYAFNHAEAIRAFRQAALLDPDCAMAYWGHALAAGPNINAAMSREAELEALAALDKALALKPKVSQKERDYIDALANRYSKDEDADRAALDQAYADAMRDVAARYPDDLDAATLYAESLMDVSPWNYWTRDGNPRPDTPKLLATLESVIERKGDHPGALHLYIHAVEASKNPERAEAAADRLGGLMPSAGHLVHMPSHIFIRVGRYADASRANVLASDADQRYITQCRAQGLYPLTYHPHNIHFLWAAATFEGRSKTAIDAAQKLHDKVNKDKLMDPELAALQMFHATPLFALTRFGKWDEILELPAPESRLRFENGVWHYARGIALTAQGRYDDATVELAKLKAITAEEELAQYLIWGLNSLAQVLEIAEATLAGELAAARGDYDEALSQLDAAIRLDDGLIYSEPHDWHYPPRQSLGAVLLAAGRPVEAETVYWEDLRRNRENGWSLFGLVQSLEAQGKTDEAAAARARFEAAWKNADVELGASRF